MSERPDPISPDMTVASVFEGLHGQVQSEAEALRQIGGYGADSSVREIPGFDLWVRTWQARNHPHQTTVIGAKVEGIPYPLLAVSGSHSVGYLPPETFPSGVEGFLGAERDSGYSLSRERAAGKITARLTTTGRLGAIGIAGESQHPPKQAIGGLYSADRQRFQAIRAGIVENNLAAVTLILDGTAAGDALEMIDYRIR